MVGRKYSRKKSMTTYCFDLDGTLCTNTEGDYERAAPIADAISAVNRLYANGHTILIQTARGFSTGINWLELTKKQLKDWGVNYHELHFNKVSANVYIDDKAINIKQWQKIGLNLDPHQLISETNL